jgi:uncharacterized membrane protein
MNLPSPGTTRLEVLRAVEEGWQAFCRAPWSFLLFQVLALVVGAPFALLAAGGLLRLTSAEPAFLPPPAAGAALVVGVLGYAVVALWGLTGLVRGAWLCLEGQRPPFRSFSRWDGAAAGRLLLSLLLLVLVVVAAALAAAVAGSGLGQLNAVLAGLPLLLFAAAYIWFLVTQKFLVQRSLLGSRQPQEALRAGVAVVNPSWWAVLWLAIVETVMLAIAMLFNYGGLFVILPVTICVSTAAYRQLFGAQDLTGLISGAGSDSSGDSDRA